MVQYLNQKSPHNLRYSFTAISSLEEPRNLIAPDPYTEINPQYPTKYVFGEKVQTLHLSRILGLTLP